MKYAADFRALARDALRGRWFPAVVISLVAALLGGANGFGPELKINISNSGINLNLEFANQTIFSTGGSPGLPVLLAGLLSYLTLSALVFAAVWMVLGSVVGVGYSKFTLQMVDHSEAGLEQLFQYFPYWKTAVCTRLLKGICVLLWSLLLIIPGIMASYSYAMTDFILAEHPEMRARDAITASEEMMHGNRWRLFCLQISFIGWAILCAFTFGIGNLWLNPYVNMSTAAFYREISGTERPDVSLLGNDGRS